VWNPVRIVALGTSLWLAACSAEPAPVSEAVATDPVLAECGEAEERFMKAGAAGWELRQEAERFATENPREYAEINRMAVEVEQAQARTAVASDELFGCVREVRTGLRLTEEEKVERAEVLAQFEGIACAEPSPGSTSRRLPGTDENVVEIATVNDRGSQVVHYSNGLSVRRSGGVCSAFRRGDSLLDEVELRGIAVGGPNAE